MMKKKRLRIDNLAAWQICQLGRFGGFSHRYIASLVFSKPLGRVTRNDTNCVSSCLHRHDCKVTDWRNGLTAQASEYAAKHVRPKKRQLKLLIAA